LCKKTYILQAKAEDEFARSSFSPLLVGQESACQLAHKCTLWNGAFCEDTNTFAFNSAFLHDQLEFGFCRPKSHCTFADACAFGGTFCVVAVVKMMKEPNCILDAIMLKNSVNGFYTILRTPSKRTFPEQHLQIPRQNSFFVHPQPVF
jgi:hypothetical protein